MKKNLKPIVQTILTECVEARDDDFRLIAEVVAHYSHTNLTMDDIAFNHAQYFLPSFESITRCRRTIQKKHPELVSPFSARIRKQEQENYVEMSRKGEI